jgi:hypothetical protein
MKKQPLWLYVATAAAGGDKGRSSGLSRRPAPDRSEIFMSQACDRKRRLEKTAFAALGAIAILAASALGAQARARPSATVTRSAFDGRWSVLIETERGPCDRSYRVGVDIVNGVVAYEGNPNGRVSANGNVRVHLAIGDQHADGSGRLSLASGTGLWRAVGSSGWCSGRWSAERRN